MVLSPIVLFQLHGGESITHEYAFDRMRKNETFKLRN